MFSTCYALASLDVSNFNTSNVTNMSNMFNLCSVLPVIDVSNFDTSNVTNMYLMFSNCQLVASLDVSNFNTSKVTNMASMFNGCNKLTLIKASSLFVVDQVTNSSNMFANDYLLTGGAGTTYNASNPKDKTYAHIDGGTANPGYFTAA